jgi:hypothetical protein
VLVELIAVNVAGVSGFTDAQDHRLEDELKLPTR